MNLTRLFNALLAPLLSLLVAAEVFAQSDQDVQIWVPDVEKPVQLRALDVDAKVYGFMASTILTLEFHNPNNRVLEGEFVLPLLANQRVVGYALEVNGALREGVVVPKQTARIAFEEITRRGVDPGLAEITRGNVFRTRIYPIPALGNKRISITIEQALEKHGSGMRYVMPVPVKTKLAEYRVRVEAVQASSASAGAGLKLSDAKIAERALENAVPDSPITLDLPATDAPMVYSVAEPGSLFLQVIAQVQAPISRAIAQKPITTLAIYWDSSRSGKARQHAKELAFLRAVLADKNIKTVSLTTFAISAQPARKFTRRENFAALFTAIEQVDYDGATQLDSLNLSESAELALIFTDADSTFEHYSDSAASLKRRPLPGAPRHVIAHAALFANAQGLGALAHRLNAVRLDLTRLGIAKAMQLANAPPLRAVASAAPGLCQQSPSIGAIESGIGYFSARCKQGSAISISWNQGNLPDTIIKVPAPISSNGRETQPISRAWAFETILRLQQTGESGLAQGPETVSSQTLRLALQYALVTEQTSLLVLDSIEDYVSYDIAPPEPELRAQFDAMRKVNISEVKSEKSNRLQSLTGAWQEFKRYHQSQHHWVGGALVPFALNLSARVTEPKAKRQLAELLKRTEALVALEAQKSGLPQSSRREALGLLKALQLVDSNWLASLSTPERIAELAKRATATTRSQNTVEISGQQGGAGADDLAMAAPVAMATAPAAEASMSEESEALAGISVTGSRINTERKESDSANAFDGTANATRASVAIKPYTANAPYLTRIRANKDPYAAYLIEAQADGSVGFYLDCAEYFYTERKQPEIALRVLSNIAETQVEDVSALRALAEQLRQWQFYSYSLANFQQVMQMREEEPQGARDFALALARAPAIAGGNTTLALTLLWHVASHDWDARFNSITLTSLHEFNDVLAATPVKLRPNLQALGVPDALISPLPVGLRVVMGWNANDVDIDLWVRDPLGEWAYYAQRQTESGGQMSDDFTQGYGPETFTIAKPIPGKYTIFAHYFGNSQQKLSVPITVYLEFQTPFGSGKSAISAVVRRLDTRKQDQEIGEFTVLE